VTNLLGFILSSNAVLTVASNSCAPPPSGLISWWQGDGNDADVIGGNLGTSFNGA
jgi:hypothetical protein